VNARVPAPLMALYAREPARVRAHVSLRWRTCPFPPVAARVPERGRILDYGCGHGAFTLWLAITSAERDLVGVDVAADKVAAALVAARRASAEGIRAPDFRRIRAGEMPEEAWDAILFVDVLYLIPAPEQERLLRAAARAIAPGGTLLVKEVAHRPRAKALWNRVQETVSVRLFRITAGRRLRFLSPEKHAGWLESEGLEVERVKLDRGYAHPHHLLVARRPPARGA
jgi:2-polyprenyl-3-methyl-5-hydroxy-6-metoxy-1,4-benzoquinol methylase